MSAVAGHMGPINACAFSPDGEAIVSASADGTLKLWDAETGVCEATFEGHDGAVGACAFSPDGETIVSGGDDGTLKFWDARAGAEGAAAEGHADEVDADAFLPDADSTVSKSWGNLGGVSGLYDPTREPWNADPFSRA